MTIASKLTCIRVLLCRCLICWESPSQISGLQREAPEWQVLTMLAERKAIAVMRRELADKRGGGLNRGESVFEKLIAESSVAGGIDQVADPDPAIVDGFTQEVREMLEGLDDELLQKIAMKKLEGYTNREIAQQLDIALRAVKRKLQLIRQKWEYSALDG